MNGTQETSRETDISACQELRVDVKEQTDRTIVVSLSTYLCQE